MKQKLSMSTAGFTLLLVVALVVVVVGLLSSISGNSSKRREIFMYLWKIILKIRRMKKGKIK